MPPRDGPARVPAVTERVAAWTISFAGAAAAAVGQVSWCDGRQSSSSSRRQMTFAVRAGTVAAATMPCIRTSVRY